MPARALWQGQIRLALVSIPVEIYPATRSGAGISFRQIHEPSGKPVHYEKTVRGIGPVDPETILKGYEYEKGSYVLLEPEEIEGVRIESRRTLELVQFVDAREIDLLYYEKPYYVVPADTLAEEAYAVLRDALRKTGRVGLGQLAMRGREHVVAIKPCGPGLLMETLRYADELNRATGFFRGLGKEEADPELLELAETLIERKTAPFDATAFHDRYADALRALVDAKIRGKGETVTPEEEVPQRGRSNVIDLMAALRQSVDKAPERAPAKAPAKGAGKPAGRESAARRRKRA